MLMKTWEDCVYFHGHQCGGLTIGYKASLYAIKLLDLTFSKDEQVACISETDGCSVDAISVMLGCSIGKGNLIIHQRGKSAFSFYSRATGKSVRLALRQKPEHITKAESFAYYQSLAPEEMFDVKETVLPLPEKANLYPSHVCRGCGELTGEKWMVQKGTGWFCLDCAENQ